MFKKSRIDHHKPFFKKLRLNYFAMFGVISLITILAYFFMIKKAILDETMLYSWAWIVQYLNVKLFFLLLIVIIIISVFIARIDFKLKRRYFLPTLFILAFILSSLMWSAPDPNPDVAEFFGVAKYIEINGLFDYFFHFGTDALDGYRFHSLLPLIGLAFIFFGESALVVHIIMSLLYAFIPVLTFLIAWKLFDKRTAFISSLLILGMPLMLVQSSMFMVDVPTVFFVLLALFTFYLFLNKRKIYYYPLSAITLLFALLSKRPAALFLILSLFVMFIIVKNKKEVSFKHLSLKVFILVYIAFIFLFAFIFLKLDFFSDQLSLDLSQANITGNPQHFVNPLSYLFQIQPLIIMLFVAFLVLFIITPKLSYLFLFVWIFFPYVFIYDTTIRYMLPAFPAIAMAAAIALNKFKKPVISFAVSLIVLSSVLSVAIGYLPLLKNEFYDNNIKLAAKYLDDSNIETIGVYMFYNDLSYTPSPKTEIYAYVFDYYSNKRIFYDKSESVKKVYSKDSSRFNVFDYYKDENYLTPNYDAVVIFSNMNEYQTLPEEDVKSVTKTMNEHYFLNKTFSVGNLGVEQNKYAFIYLKK